MKTPRVKYLAAILASVLLAASAFAGIGAPPFNQAAVAITGGTINGATTASVAAVAAGSVYNPASVAITGGTINNTTIKGAANLLISTSTPSISSGFGTSPSIVSSNGTATFKVNVGTGGTATSGIIAMPTAQTGWNCLAQVPTNASYFGWITVSPSSTSTSVTFENRNTTNGVLSAWPASVIFTAICIAF